MMRLRTKVCAVLAATVVVAGLSFNSAKGAAGSKLPLGSKNTIVTIRVKSIDTAIKAVSQLVSGFSPDVALMLEQGVNKALEKFRGIDRTGPVAFLILDPEKLSVPLVVMFTLKDPNMFKNGGVKRAPVRAVGRLGVVSQDPDGVAEVAQYLKGAGLRVIPTADMQDMAVATTHVGVLVKRYRKDIQEALDEAKAEFAAEPKPGQQDALRALEEAKAELAAEPKPGQQEVLRALGYAAAFVAAVEQQVGLAELGLSVNGQRIRLRSAVEATPGSAFAAFLKKSDRPVSRELANFLPPNAVSSWLMSYDPHSMAELVGGLAVIACDIFGLSEAETNTIRRTLVRSAKSFSGLAASAEVPVEGGLGGIGLQGIRDRDTARACAREVYALAEKGALGKLMKKYGVALQLTEKHRVYKDIPIDKLEISVDLDRLVAALPFPPVMRAKMKEGFAEQMKTAFGHEGKMVIETVYGRNLAASAYGLHHAELINKEIELIRSAGANGLGNTPEYHAVLAEHPEGFCAFSHTSLFGKLESIAKAMSQKMGPMMMPMQFLPTRAELPPDEELISGAVHIEGCRATLTVHVPIKPVRDIADAVKVKMQKMMEERMNRMRNAPPRPPADTPPMPPPAF